MTIRRLQSVLRRDLPVQITIANLLALALSLATVPIIARGLGPEGRGVTASAMAMFVLAPVLIGAGLPMEVRRRCAQGIDAPTLRSARDLVAMLLVPAAALAGLVSITIFRNQSFDLRATTFLGVALSPVALSWAVDTAALVGSGRYRAVFVIRVLQPATTLAMLPALWILNVLTPVAILVVFIAANCLTMVAGWIFVGTSILGARAEHAALLRAGAAFAGAAIAEAAGARVDQILVLPLIGATEAGLYSVAVSVAGLPLALGHALGAASFRRMAHCVATDGPVSSLAKSELNKVVSLGALVVAALGASGAWGLPLVFGAGFADGVPVLLLLLPGSLCMTVAYVASMLLAAQGRGRSMTATQFVGLSIGIALLYLLADDWRALGAAAASTTSYVALLTLQARALRAFSGLTPTPSGIQRGVKALLS